VGHRFINRHNQRPFLGVPARNPVPRSDRNSDCGEITGTELTGRYFVRLVCSGRPLARRLYIARIAKIDAASVAIEGESGPIAPRKSRVSGRRQLALDSVTSDAGPPVLVTRAEKKLYRGGRDRRSVRNARGLKYGRTTRELSIDFWASSLLRKVPSATATLPD